MFACMTRITPEPVMRIALGFMAAKHPFIASTIGLFEALDSDPAMRGELVQRCGVPERTLGISVDEMTSLGPVEKDGDRYRNGDAAAFWQERRDPMLRVFDQSVTDYGRISKLPFRAGEWQFGGFSAEQSK